MRWMSPPFRALLRSASADDDNGVVEIAASSSSKDEDNNRSKDNNLEDDDNGAVYCRRDDAVLELASTLAAVVPACKIDAHWLQRRPTWRLSSARQRRR